MAATPPGKASLARSQQEANQTRTLAQAEVDRTRMLGEGEASKVVALAAAEAERVTKVGLAQAEAIEKQAAGKLHRQRARTAATRSRHSVRGGCAKRDQIDAAMAPEAMVLRCDDRADEFACC